MNGLILIHSFDHFRLYRVFSFFSFFFLSIITNCLKFEENREAFPGFRDLLAFKVWSYLTNNAAFVRVKSRTMETVTVEIL